MIILLGTLRASRSKPFSLRETVTHDTIMEYAQRRARISSINFCTPHHSHTGYLYRGLISLKLLFLSWIRLLAD